MGSLLALDLAFIEKKKVNKIVLIGTCFPMDVSDELLKYLKMILLHVTKSLINFLSPKKQSFQLVKIRVFVSLSKV